MSRIWWPELLMSGVNYFFGLTTTISPYQRQLLLDSWAARSARRRAEGVARPRGLVVCFSDIYIRGGGKVEKPVFGFPLFHPPSSPELWECGNLACLWRDSQGARGKRGKPAFGFPRFPQPRHFHSSRAFRFS